MNAKSKRRGGKTQGGMGRGARVTSTRATEYKNKEIMVYDQKSLHISFFFRLIDVVLVQCILSGSIRFVGGSAGGEILLSATDSRAAPSIIVCGRRAICFCNAGGGGPMSRDTVQGIS